MSKLADLGALAAHYAQEVTTVATFWKAARTDGQTFGFTNHHKDIEIDGVTYLAAAGFTPTNAKTALGFQVDDMEMQGALSSPSITEADLMAGLWDFAEIEVFRLNYKNPAGGRDTIMRGRIGEVRTGNGIFTAEMRSISNALSANICEVTTPTCRATFCDSRCKLNIVNFTAAGTITGLASRMVITDTGRAEADGYFDGGKITMTSGANAGRTVEVKSFSAAAKEITLQLAFPYTLAIGDTYSIVAGCGKRLVEDCKTKFNNVVNFRGEPYLPGIDHLTKNPI